MSQDKYPGQNGLLTSSARFNTITPSDTVDLVELPKFICIGATGGALVVHNEDGTSVTFTVVAGQVLYIRPRRVLTSSVATPIIAVY